MNKSKRKKRRGNKGTREERKGNIDGLRREEVTIRRREKEGRRGETAT
jgi:hypothetical protein